MIRKIRNPASRSCAFSAALAVLAMIGSRAQAANYNVPGTSFSIPSTLPATMLYQSGTVTPFVGASFPDGSNTIVIVQMGAIPQDMASAPTWTWVLTGRDATGSPSTNGACFEVSVAAYPTTATLDETATWPAGADVDITCGTPNATTKKIFYTAASTTNHPYDVAAGADCASTTCQGKLGFIRIRRVADNVLDTNPDTIQVLGAVASY